MQFARDNPGINVVGVGAGTASNGDSLAGAVDFAERNGTAAAGITMIYDVTFQSWRNYGVISQPWVVLIDAQGNQVYNAPGRVDFSTIPPALGQ